MKNSLVSIALVFAFVFTASCGSEPAGMMMDGGTPVVTVGNDGGSGCNSADGCQYPTAAWCVVTNSVGVCAYIGCEGGCKNGWVCDTVAQPNHCRPPDAPMPDAGTICDHVVCGVGMNCVLTDMGQAECRMMDAGVSVPDAGVSTPDAGTTTPICATFCPADNTCQIDATRNTVTCIPPTTTTPDAGVSIPDAGTVIADAGVQAPDAGTPPTLGCADVCPVGNTCVVDIVNRTIVCIPPSNPDAGTPIADAGIQTPDAGVTQPDAGTTTPDAGVSTPDAGMVIADAGAQAPDAGVTPADAGVQPPADAGVITPVDGGMSAPPTVPQGANGVVRITFQASRLGSGCSATVAHVAAFGNTSNWSIPIENTTLSLDVPVYYHGSMDTTIHCIAHSGGSSTDYTQYGANGQTAAQVGYSEVSFYFPGGGRQDLLGSAKTLNSKLVVPLDAPWAL